MMNNFKILNNIVFFAELEWVLRMRWGGEFRVCWKSLISLHFKQLEVAPAQLSHISLPFLLSSVHVNVLARKKVAMESWKL